VASRLLVTTFRVEVNMFVLVAVAGYTLDYIMGVVYLHLNRKNAPILLLAGVLGLFGLFAQCILPIHTSVIVAALAGVLALAAHWPPSFWRLACVLTVFLADVSHILLIAG